MRPGALASLILALCAGTGLPVQGMAQDSPQPRESFTGEFDPVAALIALYGRPPWNDLLSASRSTFGNGSDFIEPLYDAGYVEGGVEKHVVIATLTPRPRSQYNCNACAPKLGGAVFRRDGNVWRIEAKGLEIETGDARHWRLGLVRVGPDRLGLLHEVHVVGQGHEWMRASLIFGVDAVLASRLVVPPVEGPGPGTCAMPAQQLKVEIGPGGEGSAGPASRAAASSNGPAPEFYDAVVVAQWNDARCVPVEGGAGAKTSGRACQRTTRYRFRGGNYVEAAAVSDVCTQLPEVAVDVRG